MAHEVTLIGKFLGTRAKNPDTANDPYNPAKESPLELDLPNHDLTFSQPAPLPPPPKVLLGVPSALPPPPAVVLDPINPIPPPPGVVLSVPAVLPPEPAPPASVPAILPLPPTTTQLLPSSLPVPPSVIQLLPSPVPPPPPVILSSPGILPPLPPVVQSVPAILPPVPPVVQSLPGALPAAPAIQQSIPAVLPPPDAVTLGQSLEVKYGPLDPKIDCTPAPDPDPKKVNPTATPSSGYSILGETYSPMLGAADPGSLALDPFMYERQLERGVRLGPGKLALHALTQVGLFAQNVYGTVWNPALAAPPPLYQSFLKPALDLGDSGTKDRQVQIGELVNFVLDGTPNTTGKNLVKPEQGYRADTDDNIAVIKERQGITRGLSAAFDNVANSVSNLVKNGLTAKTPVEDLLKTRGLAFENGIIPMRVKGDNKFGFRTFRGGAEGAEDTTDDSVYVPLCFTDLRPVGEIYRTVYFRPIIKSLTEGLAPEWNKSQYLGRVDPVATYMSTTRTINLSFQLIAFGPEDVRTIYQKLHWLSSMVYPEYDKNLSYRSGPVVRMRIGDVVNAVGKEGAFGLPGIIESLDFDYTDSLWELKENFKLPREVNVSLTFTALHDSPIGRGKEGNFGGLNKSLELKDLGESNVANERSFRDFGSGAEVTYDTLGGSSDEK